MAYQPLDEQTVIDYVKNRAPMQHIFPQDANLSASEVGDGNLNLVFIIRCANYPDRSAVVKQALPYLRVAGESWPLTRERVRFEAQSLMQYNQLAPGLAPEVYDYNDEMSALTMEYLGHHQIMRKPLVARQVFPNFVDHISTFLARTLFFTSDLYLTGPEKKALQAKYINPALCKIQEDFVYTNPYKTSPENKWNPKFDAEVRATRANAPLKIAIAEVKETYIAHAQALVHGDLHTGSIMVNETETKVIDSEFAFYGPMGYDIGNVLAHLVLNYLTHYAHTPNAGERATYQAYLLDTTRDVWVEFARKFEALWVENNRGELGAADYWDFPGGQDAFARFRQNYILSVLRDTAGHGGCEMLRRLMGIVTIWDISSIQDLDKRAAVERLALAIGSRWVMERNQMNSINDLIGIVREETRSVTL